MATIRVEPLDGEEFRVEVEDETGSSRHRVTAPAEKVEELGAAGRAEELLEASFRFLLEREPRSAILSRFQLSTITRFFPEYPDEIRSRMG